MEGTSQTRLAGPLPPGEQRGEARSSSDVRQAQEFEATQHRGSRCEGPCRVPAGFRQRPSATAVSRSQAEVLDHEPHLVSR